MRKLWIVVCVFFSFACGDDPVECVAGAAACECTAEATCSDGLMCVAGICGTIAVRGVTITNTDARSCEFIFVEAGIEVLDVEFGSGVTGTYVREAPNSAVTFYRDVDSPFPADAISVRTAGDAGLSVERAACFDREGRPLTGDVVRLES